MTELKLSTAHSEFVVLRLSVDKSLATGITAPDVTLYVVKDDGTVVAGDTSSWSEVSASSCPGLYRRTIPTTENDQLGMMVSYISATSCDTVPIRYDVVAKLAKDVDDSVAGVQTQVDTTGVALLASAVDDVWDELSAGHVTADTMGAIMNAVSANADPLAVDIAAASYTGTQLGAILKRIASGAALGSVSGTLTYLGLPLVDARVWLTQTNDITALPFVETRTASDGTYTLYAPASTTFYLWKSLYGYSFDPMPEVVTPS